ncbi:PREDICTED: nucleoredoxin-like protein 1 [Pseudopodoces humilis]|uniref:nucleoredoxin-like protein 1 n=1 Tax=Pseudopodoces humilis TaxID=181119 RepID=UPI0006B776BD|nr:PREDICTED: nucleoredoxin-like protein 1 [Pseudopodoces humilis]
MAWALFSGRSLLTRRSDVRLDTERELRRALENRVLLLLFSARRCPRCRGFEPRLRRFWSRLTDPAHVERPEQVSLVYLGMDRCEQEHRDYVRNMPRGWMALPYGDELGRELQLRFGVSEPPAVVVLDPGGSVLAGNAVREIRDSGASCFRGWREAAELLDRNFQEPQEAEGSVRRSLTEPLRRLKYRMREEEEEEEEEGGKEEEEGE